MTCAHCGATLEGRKRKYCDKLCCNRAAEAKRMRSGTPCSVSECGKPTRARGLCTTHYNRQQPNRHRKVVTACSSCGAHCEKEPSQLKKYAAVYCSQLCRDYGSYGPTTCALPSGHWARWYGTSSEWQTPLIRNTGQCAWCDAPNRRDVKALYCSPECKTKASRVRRIARVHDTIGAYTYGQLVRTWMTFGKRCAYCRHHVPLTELQAEHVIPLSKGGENGMWNILPACGACNSDKRDLLLSDWAADRERRGLMPVVTAWTADDPKYRHLVLAA